MNNPIQQFRDALARRNIIPPAELLADGILHRCDADGKNGKRDAAYLLHLDGMPAGGFENHRDGLGWESWRADIGRTLTPAEEAQHRQRIEQQRQQREQEQAERRAQAKNRAAVMWEAARKPATCMAHFYTAAKQVQPVGVRVLRGMLLVPVRDAGGELMGLQTIGKDMYGDTVKRFLSGTPIAGNYCPIGKADNSTQSLAIGEGWATMASVHAATGWPCVVAFSANNLEAVARVMRAKFPAVKIVICADDDSDTEARTGLNPGMDAAHKAAAAVAGFVAIPRSRREAAA